jgi:hypothetical protein
MTPGDQRNDSPESADEQVAEAWRVEIERRAREVLDGTIELLDYDQVMAELRALDEHR